MGRSERCVAFSDPLSKRGALKRVLEVLYWPMVHEPGDWLAVSIYRWIACFNTIVVIGNNLFLKVT